MVDLDPCWVRVPGAGGQELLGPDRVNALITEFRDSAATNSIADALPARLPPDCYDFKRVMSSTISTARPSICTDGSAACF